MGNIIAVLLGLIVAVGIAILITSFLVKKSNDSGDSTGGFEDFSKHDITIMEALDRGRQKEYEQRVRISRHAGPKRWVQMKASNNDLSGGTLDGEDSDRI